MKPTKHVASDGLVVDRVFKGENAARVIQGKGYIVPGRISCELTDTSNGFIARFPAVDCTRQDYYVCLDYAKARDLVLALSAFKSELGFEA